MLLIILILLLQLISKMFAAPPSPTMTEQEIRQQIDSIQPVLTELQNSIVELSRARDRSEVLTPSQDRIDALRSTIDVLETDVAATEKKIEEIQKHIEDLQNRPVMPQLERTQQEIIALTGNLAELKQQTQGIIENSSRLQAEFRALDARNSAQDRQPATQRLRIAVEGTDKTVFIVDFRGEGGNFSGQDRITVISTDGSPSQTFTSRAQFTNWVNRERVPDRDHFVVYVRPSRFGRQYQIADPLLQRGFDVGLQVIDESISFQNN